MSVKDNFLAYLAFYGKDEPNGLTQAKYAQRAYAEYEEDGCLYFKMERHRSALGATYTRGLPMAAFATRIDKYQYDPKDNSTSVVESVEESLDFKSIDYDRLAEEMCFDFGFEFQDNAENGYILKEHLTGDSWIVSQDEDFKGCIDEILLLFDEYFEIILNTENIDKENAKKFVVNFKESASEYLREKIEMAWDDAEFEE
ncbi:hypothetical protein [Solidesulfovibrio magneticus]|uniref:Uncharacterized protein n=1 Tax=Solidesulfovibrio magneticus (strain ATCC 700980 / DSM 13731 / RS-1) TaxID=573370 RepID=C4XNN4_SOLM1|nr:hypothetical protein [Solidesulfovibrio magneticus]BAH75009.1 hypothetical protein DMR_15180 [Solidesulfovibrio magneticus RS-1]